MLLLLFKLQEEQPDIKVCKLVVVLLLKASHKKRTQHQLWQQLWQLQVRSLQGDVASVGQDARGAARHQSVQAQLQQEEQGAGGQARGQGGSHLPAVQEQQQGTAHSLYYKHAGHQHNCPFIKLILSAWLPTALTLQQGSPHIAYPCKGKIIDLKQCFG